jgi:hypothetical protein
MNKKFSFLYSIFLLSIFTAHAQIENVIIITTDGLRWQEVFNGMDTTLANRKRFNEGDSNYLYQNYWAASPQERRKKLMPFLWNYIAEKGSIFGNRIYNNKVDVANSYWFSYPGYSEIFTGYADNAVNSNNHPPNGNINLLEFLNRQSRFKRKTAAFAAWNAFDRILNETRSGFPVINAFDTVSGKITSRQNLINQMLTASYRPWNNEECLDVFTHFAAMEYLKTNKPKVLFIGYGETDEWAHGGKYRSYLDAARQVDAWIGEIWNYVQSDLQYKNKTALFITTDHGRGGGAAKEEWQSHGNNIAGASEIWFAVISPNLKPFGEATTAQQFYAEQFAQTIASLLGVKFTANHPVGEKIILPKIIPR